MLGAYAYALMKDDEKIFSVFYKRVDGGGLVRWRLTAGSQLHELKFLETPEGLPN